MKTISFGSLGRRDFLTLLGAGGAAAATGLMLPTTIAAPKLETTRIRLAAEKPACWAPQYLAEAILRAEGFTDVTYVPAEGGAELDERLHSGSVDIALGFSGRQIKGLTPGDKAVFLSGLHAGCYTLFAGENVRSLKDLKGNTVRAGRALGDGPYVFFATIAAYVGLDPEKDFKYVWVSPSEARKKFEKGEIDAILSFTPEPQELRAKGIGRVLVDTNVDRPWAQYFCCTVMGNRDFIENNPVATQRVLRAILMGNDLCTQKPTAAADALINKKVRKEAQREYIVQAMKDIPYDKWRSYNPEDTVRYYALRLRELGLIDHNPQEIIARNTDWSFLESLRDELSITF